MADLKTLLALLNEIDVMRSLHHDSIIRLHRVYEDEHQVHLVMDYAAGKELYSRVVKRKRYSEE
jgi:carbon catabolite-derepressing protein kinase